MQTMTMPKPKLRDDALYLGDNGRCFCGAHAGVTARFTGRDLSGQRVMHLTRTLVDASGFNADFYHCETPQCAVVIP